MTCIWRPPDRTASFAFGIGSTAGSDRAVRIWNTATGEAIKVLTGHAGETTGVAFTPDGQSVISAGSDRTVRVWNAADGVETATFNEKGMRPRPAPKPVAPPP